MMEVDYSLYLVTDSTPAILGKRDLVVVVEAALEGGVTLVQYRDKTSETADLIRMGRKLHALTQRYRVPLLINDRVDVALAIGAEGVHIGQDDMDLHTARKLLGPKAIIGVSASCNAEAVVAVEGGASYLGIGTVYATRTKEDTKSIIGPAGVRHILRRLSSTVPCLTPTVAIGGLNPSNIQRVMFQSSCTSKNLDGVAVVSSIVGAQDPCAAASALLKMIKQAPIHLGPGLESSENLEVQRLLAQVPGIVKKLSETIPLCHNMTNLVVQNFAANVALSIGASPIMANHGKEAADLAQLGGSLVINMGTVTSDGLANYEEAIKAYNEAERPVLLDPVGAGATAVRRDAVKRLLKSGYFTVIKGNENEIMTVSGNSIKQQKGVDSGTSSSSNVEKARLIQKLATEERNIILMTGKTDFLSDGQRTVSISNGHRYLGEITGSGCTLGTTIAAFLAVHETDKLLAALSGILMYEIAAERAGVREDVKGPGTFVPAFLDELYKIRKTAESGDSDWLSGAEVEDLKFQK